ncbi:hypothetical protein ACFQ61_08585 [Streptomyces sp. NPDC056500]|uniref:hypothetical protein n=1 Tax=Streptomyces sp. NPDC056500 TaxID=3345840 RepID=UPI00369A81E8
MFVLVAMLWLSGCTDHEGGSLDESSYRAGYGSFGGAFLPTDSRSRTEIETSCEDLFRVWAQASTEKDIVRRDWIEGCADVAQNKESRVEEGNP